MIINRGNLDLVYTAYNGHFQNGLQLRQESSQFQEIAMVVPSTTAQEKYGWIGKIPNLREWLGPRVVHGLEQHDLRDHQQRQHGHAQHHERADGEYAVLRAGSADEERGGRAAVRRCGYQDARGHPRDG